MLPARKRHHSTVVVVVVVVVDIFVYNLWFVKKLLLLHSYNIIIYRYRYVQLLFILSISNIVNCIHCVNLTYMTIYQYVPTYDIAKTD